MSGIHSFFCFFPTLFYSPLNTNTYGTIAAINRIARNAVYIGQRSSTFHEPDPANPLPAYKRKDRKVYLELNVEQSELWILVIVHFVDGSERWRTIRKANTAEAKYGQGFDRTNLYYYLDFAKVYPTLFDVNNQLKRIVHTACGESDIYSSLMPETPIQMSWSHYRTLLQVDSDDARLWYEKEVVNQAWSVRTLQRNIASQYYFRLLQSPAKDKVEAEMKALTAPLQDKLEYMKNPVVAEFLGFHNNTDFSESDLEQSILNHLTTFLMELGKGFAFVDRQKHIHTEKKDYYIDLVFYNYLLKCFVLVDLKTNTVDYQDAGQMDMYVKMYDEKYRSDGDNPTIGILLCADTDADVAKYSCLHDNDQLYMAKYLTYMPTQEELRREIEQQKMIFALKSGKEKA